MLNFAGPGAQHEKLLFEGMDRDKDGVQLLPVGSFFVRCVKQYLHTGSIVANTDAPEFAFRAKSGRGITAVLRRRVFREPAQPRKSESTGGDAVSALPCPFPVWDLEPHDRVATTLSTWRPRRTVEIRCQGRKSQRPRTSERRGGFVPA